MNYKPHKPVLYTGQKLKGEWQITTKIDGVRCLIDLEEYQAVSRRFKPFFNFSEELYKELLARYPNVPVLDCEVFRNSWSDTITLLKKDGSSLVTQQDMYMLTDDLFDRRLHRGWVTDPTPEEIEQLLLDVRNEGYEGLVLRQGDKWYKVKAFETYDVVITAVEEGQCQPYHCEECSKPRNDLNKNCMWCGLAYNKMTPINSNALGAVVTDMGKVGTGFTKYQQEALWEIKDQLIGMTIEVKCMELTEKGKFRHPTFVRFRPDKDK